MKLTEIRSQLRKLASKKDAIFLQRFFKTGPGEYGEGDVFIGVRVPQTRKLAQACKDTSLTDTTRLLKSKIHEERLLALFILVQRYRRGDEMTQKRVYDLYLKHTRYINNWDLVDGSAHHIVGDYLFDRDKKPLYRLARSKMLWERRIAIMSTLAFLKQHHFTHTFRIAKHLLDDGEDLIHKATGWMLREVGNRDINAEETFLEQHYKKMPRTMLRYAIEKFPETKRQRYLKGKI